MSSPLLSIVMPTYNASEFLDRALSSILDQSFEKYELIIVDDGSSDGTVEQIQATNDERIRLIQRESTGITSALNRGIEESRGEYIARHDADDWSHPDRLETQIEYLESHPNVAMVGTGAYLVDENGRRISRRRVLEDPTLDDLASHNEFIHGSVMMHRDPVERLGGYDEWYETAEDYDLWLRMASEYEVRNIDEPLYHFRLHDESIYAANLELLKLYHVLTVRRNVTGLDSKLERKIEDQGIDVLRGEMTEDEQKWFHTALAREFIRYHMFEKGRLHAKRSLSIKPLSPAVVALFALSFTGPQVVDFVVNRYRSLINLRIALANRSVDDRYT